MSTVARQNRKGSSVGGGSIYPANSLFRIDPTEPYNYQDFLGEIPAVADGDPIWRVNNNNGEPFPFLAGQSSTRPPLKKETLAVNDTNDIMRFSGGENMAAVAALTAIINSAISGAAGAFSLFMVLKVPNIIPNTWLFNGYSPNTGRRQLLIGSIGGKLFIRTYFTQNGSTERTYISDDAVFSDGQLVYVSITFDVTLPLADRVVMQANSVGAPNTDTGTGAAATMVSNDARYSISSFTDASGTFEGGSTSDHAFLSMYPFVDNSVGGLRDTMNDVIMNRFGVFL